MKFFFLAGKFIQNQQISIVNTHKQMHIQMTVTGHDHYDKFPRQIFFVNPFYFIFFSKFICYIYHKWCTSMDKDRKNEVKKWPINFRIKDRKKISDEIKSNVICHQYTHNRLYHIRQIESRRKWNNQSNFCFSCFISYVKIN